MRELKFKVWMQKERQMRGMQDIGRIDFGLKKLEILRYDLVYDIVDFEKNFLLQFSGLKDRNNKEIYEADILKIKNEWDEELIGIVKYGQYRDKDLSRKGYDLMMGWFVEICYKNKLIQLGLLNGNEDTKLLDMSEVIGNIYETPELVKI